MKAVRLILMLLALVPIVVFGGAFVIGAFYCWIRVGDYFRLGLLLALALPYAVTGFYLLKPRKLLFPWAAFACFLMLAVSGFAMIPQPGNPDSGLGTWVARSIFLPGTLVIIAAVVARYVELKKKGETNESNQ